MSGIGRKNILFSEREYSMPRQGFDQELNELRTKALAIGSEVDVNLMKVTRALIERNENVAQQLIDADKDINRRYIELVMRSLKLIATQQPMAGDMHFIAAVI
jgi:phosphate transport system protein